MRITRLLIFLALILCAATFETRAQDVKLVERMPDGSLIVRVDGVEYRALGAEKLTELAAQKIELNAARETIRLLNEKQTLLEKKDAALEAKDAASAEQIKVLSQLVTQLSTLPKQSRASSALGMLLKLGEVGWRIYATAK